MDRYNDNEGHGWAPRREFGKKPEIKGETDSSGNYRNDNVWRSARANPRRDDGFKKPWEKREGGRDRRDDRRGGGGDRGGFQKPWERRDAGFGGDRRDSGDRGGDRGGFQKPWERRNAGFGGDRRDSGDRGGDRGGFQKPWEKREGGRDRRDDRRGGGGDRGGFQKPWERRDGGFDRGRGDDRRGGGFQKPWERREGGFDRGRSDDRRGGGFQKPWERREGGSDRGDAEQPPVERAPKAPETPEGEWLFGRQPVREMLRGGRRIVKLMVIGDNVKDSDEINEIKTTCEERGIKTEYHKKSTLDSWLNSANHQGVVAACEEYPYVEIDEILAAMEAKEGNALVVILDHVVDPQNLGSLMRTCEAAGVVGVVIPSDRAVGVTPAAVRASAGAAEHLLISRVPNLVSVIERLKTMNVWTTGLEAIPESKPYTEIDFKGKVCIVIGSEGHGLSTPVRKQCDNLVRLPMFGKVSSLNAGVAGAIALYEVLRQQDA